MPGHHHPQQGGPPLMRPGAPSPNIRPPSQDPGMHPALLQAGSLRPVLSSPGGTSGTANAGGLMSGTAQATVTTPPIRTIPPPPIPPVSPQTDAERQQVNFFFFF